MRYWIPPFLLFFLLLFPQQISAVEFRTPKLQQSREISCHGLCTCSPNGGVTRGMEFFSETDVSSFPSMESCPAFTENDPACKGASLSVVQCQFMPFGWQLPTSSGLVGSYHCVKQSLCANNCESVGLCGEETGLNQSASQSEVRIAVIVAINKKRQEMGLGPISTNTSLQKSAEKHVQEMFFKNYFLHTSLAGDDEIKRAQVEGYIGWVGDAMLMMYPIDSIQNLVAMGLNTNPHWNWVYNNAAKDIGIGFMSPFLVVSIGIP